ncbi:MAG TPA: glycosyltransferase [Pirellulales bacterium]|jgi:dolichyl-phosphate beta-glucosyltransferase|nr:glycosyltransferase [Pirellulales bacterium]HEX4145759.1 glycosyltransferase [Pirellulales bacterium]
MPSSRRPTRLDAQHAAGLHATGRSAVPDHDLTLIIPAYNEEGRLPATLHGVRDFLEPSGLDYRVLVVDDGSRDRTCELARPFGRRFSTLRLPGQRGKGCAVRSGVLQSTGRVVAFTDADLPYDLSALQNAYRLIDSGGCDVVFGGRDVTGSVDHVPRRWSRRAATWVFREVIRLLVSRDVTDTQCGLKAFSRRAAYDVFSQVHIDGFAFDVEVVFLVHRLGLRYRRIPVSLVNEYASTLSLSRHALPMLLDVLKLQFRRNARRLPVAAVTMEVAPSEIVPQRDKRVA